MHFLNGKQQHPKRTFAKSGWKLAMAGVLSALCLTAAAQSDVNEPEEVVVTGTAPEALEVHVEALMYPGLTDQIARWNEPLCPSFANLGEKQAKVIKDHMEKLAKDVRITVGGDGCQPNVLLLFTGDADATAKGVVDHFDYSIRIDGAERIDPFLNSDKAMRWLATFDRCGFGCELPNSRITAPTAPSITRMIFVIDAKLLGGRDIKDIADYIAFATLVNPSPNGAPGLDSILKVFDAPPNKIVGLSPYDHAYLDAVYTMRMDRFSHQQKTAISSLMLAELNKQQQ